MVLVYRELRIGVTVACTCFVIGEIEVNSTQPHNKRMQADAGKAVAADAER